MKGFTYSFEDLFAHHSVVQFDPIVKDKLIELDRYVRLSHGNYDYKRIHIHDKLHIQYEQENKLNKEIAFSHIKIFIEGNQGFVYFSDSAINNREICPDEEGITRIYRHLYSPKIEYHEGNKRMYGKLITAANVEFITEQLIKNITNKRLESVLNMQKKIQELNSVEVKTNPTKHLKYNTSKLTNCLGWLSYFILHGENSTGKSITEDIYLQLLDVIQSFQKIPPKELTL